MSPLIERMAKAMYELDPGCLNGRTIPWEEVGDSQEGFRVCARAALSAMGDGALEEAAIAFVGEAPPLDCGRDVPHFIDGCAACSAIAKHEDVVRRLKAAHPLLIAPLVVENERLEERVALLENGLVRWGWTNLTCPDGQTNCFLPPGHSHAVGPAKQVIP